MRAVTAVFAALFFMFFINDVMAKNFRDNGNGTVTDNDTGLVWQEGEGGTMNWEAALSYCEGLPLVWEDWRLPSYKELHSLVDYSKGVPALDTAYFPGVVSSSYWSSTTYVYDTYNAWAANFSNGGVYGYGKSSSNGYVRCVRGGQ